MAGRIKSALIRARLRAQAARELRRLPLDEWAEPSLDGWLIRFKALPPEAWGKAVDLRREEFELRRCTPKRSFNWEASSAFEMEVDDRLEDVEIVAARWDDYEERYRAFWSSHLVAAQTTRKVRPLTSAEIADFEALSTSLQEEFRPLADAPHVDSPKFTKAREVIQEAARLANDGVQPSFGIWNIWISSLPEQDRERGSDAYAVWMEMILLRRMLKSVLAERDTLSGISDVEARRVLDIRLLGLRTRIERCDYAYRLFAEPFFTKHGKPPLNLADMPDAPLAITQI